MKKCSRCHQAHPPNRFHKNRTTKGGVQSYCISCAKSYRKTGAHDYKNNRSPGSKFAKMKFRAKKHGILFSITKEEWLGLLEGSDYVCWYCGDCLRNTTGGSMDRLDPDSGYSLGNVVPCCSTCNWKKHVLDFEEWLAVLRVNDDRGSWKCLER